VRRQLAHPLQIAVLIERAHREIVTCAAVEALLAGMSNLLLGSSDGCG
jgi:hypothetical protein